MKCLINCIENRCGWAVDLLAEKNPYMLRICGKHLLEYYLDFCNLCGIKEVRIVSDCLLHEAEEILGDGARWGGAITYTLAMPEDSLCDVVEKNDGFCRGCDLLIIDGFAFLLYDKRSLKRDALFQGVCGECFSNKAGQADERNVCSSASKGAKQGRFRDLENAIEGDSVEPIVTAEEMVCAASDGWKMTSETGNLFFVQNYTSLSDIVDSDRIRELFFEELEIKAIRNVSDYFALSFDILRDRSRQFVVPGYSEYDCIFTGQNVKVAKGAKLVPPLFLGNNVQINDNSTIGPGVIIEDNVLVDSGTNIRNSIVKQNSYIGMELDLTDKIVMKGMLVDPMTSESVLLSENFLTSGIDDKIVIKSLHRIFHCFLAVALILLQILPYLVIVGVGKVRGDELWKKDGDTIFKRLSLDKFHKLSGVLKGELYIAGNRILRANGPETTIKNQLPFYHPAVFSYAEMLGDESDSCQAELDDFYYCGHAGVRLDFEIVWRSLKRRLLGR